MKHIVPSVLVLAGTALIIAGQGLFGMMVLFGGVYFYLEAEGNEGGN